MEKTLPLEAHSYTSITLSRAHVIVKQRDSKGCVALSLEAALHILLRIQVSTVHGAIC